MRSTTLAMWKIRSPTALGGREASVAVACIALNYWGKHNRKMAIRGIN